MEFDLLVTITAVLGQICHIVKKRSQEGKSELSAFQRWVVKRPVNTVVAAVGAVTAAHALQVPSGDIGVAFASAFTAGFSADSLINRAG